MKAELKGLFSPDLDDLSLYKPEDNDNFCLMIELLIGPQGEIGEESFNIEVCTPQWLLSNCRKNEITLLRHIFLVFEYNYEKIYQRIKHEVEICTGNNWNEVANKLSRIAYWEFEDYS